jgi:HTTM domain
VSAPVSLRRRFADYWLGTVDARPLALFRVAFGAAVIFDAIDRLRDLRVFYTDDGLLPRALLRAAFGETLSTPLALVLGSPASSAIFFGVGIAAALLFALGVRARASSVVVWLYLTAIMARNNFVTDGGDDVMTALAFWSMFADLDAAWSLRAGPRRPAAPAFAARLLEWQVLFIYLGAGLAKHGPRWLDGSAIYHVLQNNDFARPLGMTLTQWPRLCRALSFATLGAELAFAPLLLSPWKRSWTRPLAAAAAAAMHVGIFAFLRVGMFPFVMLASLTLFVPPSLLARIDRPPRALADPRSPPRALSAALALLLIAGAPAVVAPTRASHRIDALLRRLGITQHWTMFSPDPPAVDSYWSADARLSDGRTMDPLRAAAPAMLPRSSFSFSRWYKLRDNMSADPRLGVLLMRYLCRRLHSPPLIDMTLRRFERSTHQPDESPHGFSPASTQFWRCSRD